MANFNLIKISLLILFLTLSCEKAPKNEPVQNIENNPVKKIDVDSIKKLEGIWIHKWDTMPIEAKKIGSVATFSGSYLRIIKKNDVYKVWCLGGDDLDLMEYKNLDCDEKYCIFSERILEGLKTQIPVRILIINSTTFRVENPRVPGFCELDEGAYIKYIENKTDLEGNENQIKFLLNQAEKKIPGV